jgi:beta-xylosidase
MKEKKRTRLTKDEVVEFMGNLSYTVDYLTEKQNEKEEKTFQTIDYQNWKMVNLYLMSLFKYLDETLEAFSV